MTTQAAASVAAPLHTPADQVRVNRHHADWRGWKFMWPFALVFVFVFIIPIMYAIYISFFQKRMIGGTQFVGFANYIRLFHDQQFWSAVGRVALFTVVQVPIMLFLAAAMALALDSMKLHGTKFFRISTFLPYAVPAVVSTLIWGFMYGAKYGLVGSFNGFFGTHLDMLSPSVLLASIGNIVTWEFTGYNMLIFYSSLSTIPHSLYEAASIDGATKGRQFLSITIPLISPVIFYNLVTQLVQAFQEFNGPYIITNGGPRNATTLISVIVYNTAFKDYKVGMSSAMAWVMFVIVMVLTVIAFVSQKKWVYYSDDDGRG